MTRARRRRVLVVAAGLGLAGAAVGCHHPQGNGEAPAARAAAVTPNAPAQAGAGEDEKISAEAAARQAQRYVDQMREISAGKPPATAPATEAAGPRPVISDIPPATQPAAATRPVVAATPAPAVTQPVATTAPGVSAPKVAAAVAAPKAAVSTDALERDLRRRLRENPLDTAAQLDYQLLEMLRGAQVPDLEVLAPLPVEDRETISALMDCLVNYRANAASPDNLLLTKKVRPILELADRVRARADLAVPVVALCSSVQGFGNYEPMKGAFAAGSDVRTIVYAEVANFASRLDGSGMYETRLAEAMTLYDAAGHTVWTDPQVPVVDKARTRRRDFFVPRIIRIPGTLTPGKYTLKVTVVDQAAQRLAEGTAGLVVGAR